MEPGPGPGSTTEVLPAKRQRREGGSSSRAPPSQQPAGLRLTASNQGYKMLEQMGWREGTGLGVQADGTATPLAAWKLNQGSRQGIGTQDTAQREDGSNLHQQPQEGDKPSAVPKGLPKSVDVQEPFDQKVKRVRQVVRAEQDEKEGREIQSWLYRQFRDCSSEAAHNPVKHRQHRLQALNPLL